MTATMEPETATLALTKEDVKAFRMADMVSFHRYNGGNSVRLTKTVRNAGPFDDKERHLEVSCRATVRGYQGDDGNRWDYSHASCFAMIHTAQYSECWRTIVSLLRAGDEIELEWTANDANGYLKRATVDGGLNLFHDKLHFHIRREGKRALSFYLDDSVCPNNTARMIRP